MNTETLVNIKKISKTKLSSTLAIISSVLVGLIALMITSFTIFFLRNMTAEVDRQASAVNKSVATALFQVLAPAVENKRYDRIEKFITNARTNNLIAYFIVNGNIFNCIVSCDI